MTEQTSNSLNVGRGVIGFNEDGTTWGYIRPDGAETPEVAVRGTYDATSVVLEADNIRIALAPAAKTVRGNGPRLRGSVIFTDTGETKKVVAWLNPEKRDNEGNALPRTYGLTDEAGFVPSKSVTPF